jgi:hypothetical protein
MNTKNKPHGGDRYSYTPSRLSMMCYQLAKSDPVFRRHMLELMHELEDKGNDDALNFFEKIKPA